MTSSTQTESALLTPLLENLERSIDVEVEEDLLQQWRRYCDGVHSGGPFKAQRLRQNHDLTDWPSASVNQAIADYDLMAVQQLSACAGQMKSGSGALQMVRCNYGCSIIASLFDAETFWMTEESNTLPTNHHLSGGVDTFKKHIEQGVPDINHGFGEKVFHMGEYYKELFDPYPLIQKYIGVYHPDLQGPMDNLELLWGSGLYLDVFDEEDTIHAFLNLITETYIRFMDAWFDMYPCADRYNGHWGMMHHGRLMLRDDSATNFSPDMFDEFVKPYNRRLLDHFGGGAVHYCGHGDHFIASMCDLDGVYAVNMSQPHLNDRQRVLDNTLARGIRLFGYSGELRAEVNAHEHNALVHCW